MKSPRLLFAVFLSVVLAAASSLTFNANAAQVTNHSEQLWPTAVYLPAVINDPTSTPTPTLVPTATPSPTMTPPPASEPTSTPPGSACCKICIKGKACGDTCIRKDYTCHKGPGCACNGSAETLGIGKLLAVEGLPAWRSDWYLGSADFVRCSTQDSSIPENADYNGGFSVASPDF